VDAAGASECSLLLATRLSSLGLGNTSDLLDSALDFLSLLATELASDDVAVLYNKRKGLIKAQRFEETSDSRWKASHFMAPSL